MKNWIKPLKRMDACGDALEWCEHYESLDKAWAVCPRGDWMLWLLGELSDKPESDSHKRLVLTACQCARLALPYVEAGELRPLKAIETAEAWAKGEGNITLEDVRKAAHAAAYAAYAAAYAAHAAAYAAYAAADAASAANGAYAAAYAAAEASYASYAAGLKTLAKCADIARQYYPVAPIFGAKRNG